MSTGLTHACEKRFALGINYAWHNFAADFGGLAAWSQSSVSQDPTPFDTDLGTMQTNGVSVVRWWMFPDFRGDGVTFDASGDPSGITTTVVADINKALELANAHNIYLVLTLFSFDNFNPDTTTDGVLIRGMSAMVSDATRRATLISNIVTPVAAAAAASPNASHLLGWDIINEPEWAIEATGSSAANGQDFDPTSGLTAVSLADMTSLITESATALKAAAPNVLRSVGWAAAKWEWAFSTMAGEDFHQPHIYGWVDEYWPYTWTPTQLHYGDKPTVYGEFYLQAEPFSAGNDDATYATILSNWWTNGFAGAWGLDYSTESANISLIKAFQQTKGCPAGF